MKRIPSSRWQQSGALLAGVSLLAVAVNFIGIGARSIGLDESTSLVYARGEFRHLVAVVTGGDPNMGLYYVILRAWVRVFGESEVAARSLSALCAAAAVPVLVLLGARLFGTRAGLLAGLLFAVNAFIVQFAHTARAYALLVLLVTLSSYFFVAEIQQPSRRGRIAYVLCSALSIYAHYFAALVLAAHLITLVAIRRRAAFSREWLVVAGGIGLLCVPEVIFAFRMGTTAIGWIEQPSPADVVRVLVEFTGGSRLILLAFLASGAWATMLAIRERRWWPQLLVVSWLVVPLALSYVVSLMQPVFVAYYLIVCVPALLLFGVSGVARLRSVVLSAAVAAPVVVLSLSRVSDENRRVGGDWRSATRHVLAAQRPDDGILFVPEYARKPFQYYQRRAGARGPANLEGQSLPENRRIWVVIRESDLPRNRTPLQQLHEALANRHRLVESATFPRVRVELHVPDAVVRLPAPPSSPAPAR